VRKKYEATDKILGQGAFGTVILFNEKKTRKEMAVKIIRKERVNECQMMIMKDEISIMSRMDHKHVIKHVESFEDSRYVFMVMEALTNA